jgi:hypothetical protein
MKSAKDRLWCDGAEALNRPMERGILVQRLSTLGLGRVKTPWQKHWSTPPIGRDDVHEAAADAIIDWCPNGSRPNF